MTRYLIVPGRGVPSADHWSCGWVKADPEFTWAPKPPGPPFVVADRVAALHAAISSDEEPAVLIAHSAGCLIVAVWASEHTGPVHAALLVTPPYVAPGWTPEDPENFDGFTGTVPRRPLPFRSILVASQNDPFATFDQFQEYAQDWGSKLFNAGPVGHLDSKTGFGAWREGERLARSLSRAVPR